MEKKSIPENKKVIVVDCSEMQPPEPMIQIIEAMNQMGKDEMIKMIHRHPPRLLFPKIESQGYSFHMDQLEDDSIHLWIWMEDT